MTKNITSSDEVIIHYDISENFESKNALVFLHGLGGDLTALNRLRKFFEEKGYSTLAIDIRGHGKSGHPLKGKFYTLRHLVNDVLTVIEMEKLEKITLIGHCFGGMVAISVTEKIQNNIEHLVLIDTNYKAPFFAQVINFLIPLRWLIYFLAGLLPNIHNRKAVNYSKFIGGTDYSPIRIFSDITHTSVRSYTFLSKIILNLNLTSALKTITIPTLIVEGTKDTVYPPKVAEGLHKLLQNSELQYIKGANHILVITNPDKVFKTIDEFLHEKNNSS